MSLLDLETRVYSRINNKIKSKLKSKYPELTVVNTDKKPDVAKYPMVYVHELESQEIGNDLENTTINGVLSSFQISVYSNSSQDVTKEVMNEVCMIMKSMRYSIVGMPFNNNSDGIYQRVARFRRPVGDGDTL